MTQKRLVFQQRECETGPLSHLSIGTQFGGGVSFQDPNSDRGYADQGSAGVQT